MFYGINFDYQRNYVCGEVGFITDMTTIHIIDENVGLMTYKYIILLAPWIGCYGPNP